MKYQISIRQFVFLFIFTCITPLFTYVPQHTALNAGSSAYVGAVYYGIILFIFAALLIRIIHVYPGRSIFEILSGAIGSPLTRIVFLLYGIWAFLLLLYKINAYNLLIQTTLMSEGTSNITVFALFFIVLYASLKGPKTVFRVSELLYGPLILFLIFLFVFTLPNINKDFLAPITTTQLRSNLWNVQVLAPIGGNLFFLLFFLTPITRMNQFTVVKKRILQSVFLFFLISFLSILLTVGIAGATLTGEYSYSLFQAIKCITFLNSFERFDAFITLVIVVSDFITITFYLLILIKCFAITFHITRYKEIAIIALTLACTLTCISDISQFRLENIWRNYLDGISLIFQYFIPVLIGIVCCFKKVKKIE